MKRKLINRNTIIAACAGVYIFYALSVSVTILAFTVGAVLVYASVVYYRKTKNREYFVDLYKLLLWEYGIYLTIRFGKIYLEHSQLPSSSGRMLMIKLLMLLITGIVLIKGYYCYRSQVAEADETGVESENCKINKEEKQQLFVERENDLIRIKEYLNRYQVVGVNGKWGSGKSFLMKRCCSDYSNDYYFIHIHLLSCNLDEIQNLLLEEIDHLLEFHGIFSPFSRQLMRLLNSQKLFPITELIYSEKNSYAKVIDGLKMDIKKLDHPLVIIYEDIDRINKPELIGKIFSISEHLSDDNCKILYEFDERCLQTVDNRYNHDYIEKYIPHVVNLTPVSFQHMLEHLMGEIQDKSEETVAMEDFKFIMGHDYMKPQLRDIFHLELSMIRYTDDENLNPRRVQYMLDEINLALKEQPDYKQYKRQVIAFCFTKHMMHECYEKFSWNAEFEECYPFKFQDKRYRISELYRDSIASDKQTARTNAEERGILIQDVDNQKSLLMVQLFDWNYDITDIERKYSSLINENEDNIEKQNENDQINHIIWYLLGRGKSEYSDRMNAMIHFRRTVLSEPKEQWDTAITEYRKWLFYRKSEKQDNQTISRLGIPFAIDLVQAMRAVGATTEEWIQMVEFLFWYQADDKQKGRVEITEDIIACLNYCDLRKPVYLKIIEEFVGCEIVGNMNQSRTYSRFLLNYIERLSVLGYCDTEELSFIRKGTEELVSSWIVQVPDEILTPIIRKLREMKERLKCKSAEEEIETIISFLELNVRLIRTPQCIPKEFRNPVRNVRSEYKHQKEVDRLLSVAKDFPEKLDEEIETSFQDGKISVYEIFGVRSQTTGAS